VACLILVFMGRSIFFCQLRPGLNNRTLTMIKFRTMRDSYGKCGFILEDSERLTNFGRFLRASSIDELPELFNVIRGDMSLVGSRPLLTEYLSLHSVEQARRH
jgi:sugar transferase EpsL